MSTIPTPMPAPAATGNAYFVDQKKGELNELKQALKGINLEKDPKKKRETIKRVIAYMTLGIDVSRLLTEMIMAIETKDIVVKKMVYFYLCNYAHKEPDLAIMCINTLRRDCDNDDPMVRGLALRSLCGLRLESILEYVQQPLFKSLTDVSPYVRKTGVMGLLKVYHLNPHIVEENNSINQLHNMLQDNDANVVTNAILVLNEIFLDKGGIKISPTIIFSLLNRISEFSEWGLCTILDLVSRYMPSNEDEMFSIMNLLDPVLRTASSAAVVATFKCFMTFSALFVDIQPQIYARVKPPLLTLLTGSNPEVQYAILKHLQLMLQRKAAKSVYDDDFRQFYVRYNEPPYVKHLKVDILPLLANDQNARDIAMELNEYVTDVDSELSKRAIAAISDIGMRVASVSNEMTNQLVGLMDLDMPYVRSEAIKNLVNLLRIYPQGKLFILPSLSRFLKRIEDADAKAALVWILGEYGNEIVEAPYILENLIDNYSEESSTVIKLQLLTASMKLFFKRPPEVQRMLGRLLGFVLNDTNHQDVHDKGLLYYRLLQSGHCSGNLDGIKLLFNGLQDQSMMAGSSSGGKGYAELRDIDKQHQIFNEFNSLAVVYNMPSQKFIAKKCQTTFDVPSIPDFDSSINNNNIVPDIKDSTLSPPVGSSTGMNLLDLDDNHTPVAHKQSLVLKGVIDMKPNDYQNYWLSLPDLFNGKLGNMQNVPTSIQELENLLKQHSIMTLASGVLPVTIGSDGQPISGFKLFLVAGESDNYVTGESGPLYFLQLVVLDRIGEVSVIVKSTSTRPDCSVQFLDLLANIFRPYGWRS